METLFLINAYNLWQQLLMILYHNRLVDKQCRNESSLLNDPYHKNYHTLSWFLKWMLWITLMFKSYYKRNRLNNLQNNENRFFETITTIEGLFLLKVFKLYNIALASLFFLWAKSRFLRLTHPILAVGMFLSM